MPAVIDRADLSRIAEEVEMAKVCEAHENKRTADHERNDFRDAFMNREVRPEAFERPPRLVKSAPSARSWPCAFRARLAADGFAKKGYEF